MADPVRVLSLFSGIGGLDRGCHAAFRAFGFDPVSVGYVEREAFCVSVLVKAFERGALAAGPVFFGDVERLDVPAADCVVAGFPCPPVSQAGKRRGVHDDRWLWPEVVRCTRDSGARLVFVENVRGLLTANGGEAFGQVLASLADLGFDAEWCVLRASDVGAPHRRERVFLLAHRNGQGRDEHCQLHGGQDDDLAPRGDYACGCGTALGHTARECDDGGGDAGSGGGHEPPDPGLSWPPGPEDIDAWRDVLTVHPELAPAVEPEVRGVAHGVSIRMDQLRALGNACIPAQAEAAFLLLWRRLFEEEAP